MDNQRNVILAVVLTGLLLFGWDSAVRYFYPHPARPAASAPVVAGTTAGVTPALPDPAAPAKPTREGGLTSASDVALENTDLATALKSPARVAIAAPGLSGSINLVGASIDDLVINRHRANLAKNSGAERLFSPAGTPAQHYARFGWSGGGFTAPGAATLWAAPAGARLTPQTPVTLTANNATGQTFAVRFAIDDNYLITATQTVASTTSKSLGTF